MECLHHMGIINYMRNGDLFFVPRRGKEQTVKRYGKVYLQEKVNNNMVYGNVCCHDMHDCKNRTDKHKYVHSDGTHSNRHNFAFRKNSIMVEHKETKE